MKLNIFCELTLFQATILGKSEVAGSIPHLDTGLSFHIRRIRSEMNDAHQ